MEIKPSTSTATCARSRSRSPLRRKEAVKQKEEKTTPSATVSSCPNTKYADNEETDNSDDEHYVPRKVVSETVFQGNISQSHEILSCPSTCGSLTPQHRSTPKPAVSEPKPVSIPKPMSVPKPILPLDSGISMISSMTSVQLSKATDDLNQVLYEKYKLIEDSHILLNVGGKQFESSTITLRYDPSSMLAIITNPRYGYNGRKTIFIDQDPTYFHIVLNYLRNEGIVDQQSLPKETGQLLALKRLCQNLRLDGLVNLVERRIDSISHM